MPLSSKSRAFFTAAFACAAGHALAADASLCLAFESVQFNCPVKTKLASLCFTPQGGSPESLVYRYGAPGQVDLEVEAKPDDEHVFYGAAGAAAPGASVRQVWFDRGPYRYMLSQCVGGSCPKSAALSVFKNDRRLSHQYCEDTGASAPQYFTPSLADFGA